MTAQLDDAAAAGWPAIRCCSVEADPLRVSADGTVHVLRVDTPFDAESKPAKARR